MTVHPVLFDHDSVENEGQNRGFEPWQALYIVVPGKPTGAARPRVVRRRDGGVMTHMPDNSVRWEERCRQLAAAAWADELPLDEPIRVVIRSVHGRPRKLIPKRLGGTLTGPGEVRMQAELGGVFDRVPCQSKPDIDNIAKLCMDALVKAGVMRDDTRVVELACSKVYQAIGQAVGQTDLPGVEIEVWTLMPPKEDS